MIFLFALFLLRPFRFDMYGDLLDIHTTVTPLIFYFLYLYVTGG